VAWSVRLVACASALCAAAAVCAAEPESPAQEADQDASTAHVGLLHDGDPDEIRYWVSGLIITVDRATGTATNGNGILVRAAGITQCKMVVVNPATGSRLTTRPPCETVNNPSRARQILSFLPTLSKGGLKECGVLDGDQWVIDGVYKGHRFTFRIDNPQFCNDVIKDMSAFTDNGKWRAP
jgi:hypothetical protein